MSEPFSAWEGVRAPRRHSPIAPAWRNALGGGRPPLLIGSREGYVAISTRVTFQSNEYVLSVAELGLAPAKGLQVVGTLADVEFEIRRAIDRLFTGF